MIALAFAVGGARRSKSALAAFRHRSRTAAQRPIPELAPFTPLTGRTGEIGP